MTARTLTNPKHLPSAAAVAAIADRAQHNGAAAKLPGPRAEVPFHPLADAFPLIEGEEFAAFVAQLRVDGFDPAHKITIFDGRILDGRNRYRACRAAKLAPQYQLFAGPDPVAFVVRENIRRRHLDESQRAMAAAKLATLAPGRPGKDGARGLTQDAAAGLLKVGVRSAQRAGIVIEHGAAELRRQVERGEVSVSAAAEVAGALPRAEQRDLLAHGEGAILAAAKQIRARRNGERRQAKVARIVEINKGNKPLDYGDKKFVIVSADPPWRYEQPLIGDCDRSIENKYPTLTLEEICALPVHRHVAAKAAIFLHIPQPLALCETPEGHCYPHQIGRAFGDPHWRDPDKRDPKLWFRPRAQMIWEKRSPDDIGKGGGPLGMGHYVRTDHECVVIMTRGGLPLPVCKPRSVFHVRSRGRLEHSEKPAEIYQAICKMYPEYVKAGLALALFERAARPGFTVWGNQIPAELAA